jgi:hypothetical protein
MAYYLIGLFLCICCAWRVRRQQRGKRLLLCNILVILSLLMYVPFILRSLNSPLPMHAFFVALDISPLLAALPLLFYSKKHPVTWSLATFICGIVAALFLCYLFCVMQIIWSTPYNAPVPFWVEIWLPDLTGFSV